MKNALATAFFVLQAACGAPQGVSKPVVTEAQEVKSSGSEPEVFALAEQARAGVSDPELADLLVRHWDSKMQRSPVWATTLGDHRFDDQLEDSSQAAVDAERARRREFLAQAEAIEQGRLEEADRITLALFMDELKRNLAVEKCESHTWSISARGNPLVSANVLPEDHKLTTEASGDALLARYRQIPRTIDQSIANLRAGLAAGRVANAESLRRTAELVKGQLDKPVEEWALSKPALDKALASWKPNRAKAFSDELRGLVAGEIRSSLARYHEFLVKELVPAGRKGDKIGVHALQDGKACYEARIRSFISLEKSADEIHSLGLQEIERINREMAALGKRLFKAKNLAETIHKLRTDKSLYFKNPEEIIAKAESALQRARERIPEFFGILPKAECKVVEIPDYEAPYTTIAYYRQPHAEGGKPGEYFINTYKPEVRPRFEMEVLAYHESIPGHHLQIAISQERGELPAFRRYGGTTVFVEGWALYTERLSEEMGMYSGDLDRMGMLSYDAWRASRLVVDTGIHAKGWTREQAEKFMLEHTALTPDNIRNEVDRYVSWPGQAVAYKIGQLEILRMRKAAEEALGDQFDIKGFHDAVLSKGAVTMPVLEQQVAEWVKTRSAK
jgi:uncharacterized protein (DUF885 family)